MMDKQHLKQFNIEQLLDWVWIDEKLLGERTRVINAIPECPEHGRQCVEHALEWIEEVQAQRDALVEALRELEQLDREQCISDPWCSICGNAYGKAAHQASCPFAAIDAVEKTDE